MPSLDVSELNIVITILGAFTIIYGFISVKIKQVWYLGEALPAVIIGVILGPIAAKFLDAERWGTAAPEQQNSITLGVTRIVIGVQLVIAGYQLPAKYNMHKWKEMAICLLPVMTIMWLCTTGTMMLTVPKITLLAGLVIGSCVTCTDPILSQAIAKGPFADKYVPRALREIISSEAGANDGFGFPFLMLAVYLIRHADVPGAGEGAAEALVEGAGQALTEGAGEMAAGAGQAFMEGAGQMAAGAGQAFVEGAGQMAAGAGQAFSTEGTGMPIVDGVKFIPRAAALLLAREEEVGRLGGGVAKALEMWGVETWLYVVIMSVAYGAVTGYGSCRLIKFALRKKWIDGESYLLWPTALGLFIIGTCGALGTDDLLACFVAGNALNWNGEYLAETEARHDEVNSCVDVLLNFGGFMYIGTILPWSDWNDPDGTGLTYPRLFALGMLVMVLRRIPAIFITYKLMPKVCTNWKEALFMGYFGPIGIGAVFYVEHTRHLFPEPGRALTAEENDLTAVMAPVVYWLVLFSIVFHGLSIPALNAFYKFRGIPPIQDEAPVEVAMLSSNQPTPKNALRDDKRRSVVMYNRFSRNPGPNGYNISGPQQLEPAQWRRQLEEYARQNPQPQYDVKYSGNDYSGDGARQRTINFSDTAPLVREKEMV